MTTNEPETPGGKFLRDALNDSALRSVGSLEAALANVLHARDGIAVPNDETDANGRPLDR